MKTFNLSNKIIILNLFHPSGICIYIYDYIVYLFVFLRQFDLKFPLISSHSFGMWCKHGAESKNGILKKFENADKI